MSQTEDQATGRKGQDRLRTFPFAPFEWLLASRYLRTRRREGFVSVIALFSFTGIMLGVATLIIVLSVMNGFRKELLDKIVGINGHIFVSPMDTPLTDYAEVAERLSKVYGIKHAIPLVEGQAFASSNAGGATAGTGVLVRGVRNEDIVKIPGIAGNIKQGTLDGFEEAAGIALGRRVAETLGAQVGDTVILLSPKGARTPFGMTPRQKAYKVSAIFEIGMSEFDSTFVFLPIAEAQAFFDREDDVNTIEIFLNDADKVDDARAALELAAERPILMQDWRQRNRTFFSALEVERNVMFLILTLIVLVAALNIVSGLIMLVKDKSSDIAILRTMGATRGAVMRIFLVTGASIGIVGTLAGFFLGLLITMNLQTIQRTLFPGAWDPTIRFLSEIPAEINSGEVVQVVAMAIVLSVLATIFPSWRAARLDPVQALRYG
ncbi:lipoprotein-releasing ABC transporter permease subunit [Enterovirga rhinocerotis]|uniref:Lipoprotein-releasing system permease protein n=1 Tax=Enterovirga rhinocerotis TaxID=1339210 RepID=A0A4R7C6M2_9HYPH|nr:lipoprotein-releasing ABC transporter permease subunit [Enterovirga rhinocerotis]TDR94240.1 lipoprotein-releasing system permease protein [Enterovirga rhinocerotis]